jgi:poly(3-hydroxybutyrate) depolymerase
MIEQRRHHQFAATDFRADALGIEHVTVNGRRCPATVRRRSDLPFATIIEFAHAGIVSRAPALVIPPLSGHLPILLRELVAGLMRTMPVAMLQWREPRSVPLAAGRFGFNENILHIMSAMRDLGPRTLVLALCQSVVPALAATARMAQDDPATAPRRLVLVAGPVDPLANPTRVARLLRARTIDWFRANVITTVPGSQPGAGRLVYPASVQRTALLAYMWRHLSEGGELSWKIFHDDGAEPVRFPFLALFLSLMDLPAEFFLENIAKVFHERLVCEGRLSVAGRVIDLSCLQNTALMTVEGDRDDIAAPGQTSVAHSLCRALPEDFHHHMLIRNSGHLSLFYGETWRREVLPAVERFDDLTRQAS